MTKPSARARGRAPIRPTETVEWTEQRAGARWCTAGNRRAMAERMAGRGSRENANTSVRRANKPKPGYAWRRVSRPE